MLLRRRHAIPVMSLLAVLAQSPAAAQAGHVEHLKRGDTTVVRTTGNGLWGAPHDAIEVKRVGGESRETTFGDLGIPYALPGGGVLIFDMKALDGPTLRMFDGNGRFVRNVGRRGNGPGEFQATGGDIIAVAPNGSFVLRRADGLVNRYRADGTFINAFRFDMEGGGRLDVSPGPGGSTYIRGGARANTDMAYIGVRQYDTAGTVLELLPPTPYLAKPPQSNFDPLEWWFPLPDGRILATRTDRLGFLLRSGPDHRTLFLGDVVATGPLYLKDERDELQTSADMIHDFEVRTRRTDRRASVVPERKPVFSNAELAVDGRVWFRRRTIGVKVETRRSSSIRMPDGSFKWATSSYSETTVRYSAFRLDGTYLGDVQFPDGTSWVSFVGDFAWAVVTGSDGTPYLVKYRLLPRPALARRLPRSRYRAR